MPKECVFANTSLLELSRLPSNKFLRWQATRVWPIASLFFSGFVRRRSNYASQNPQKMPRTRPDAKVLVMLNKFGFVKQTVNL